MFFLVAKKLTKDEDILETIKKMRDSRGRKRDRAFLDLRDTFNPLLFKKLRSVQGVADNQDERNRLQAGIELKFFEILMVKNLDVDDPKRLKQYIKISLDRKINDHWARLELDKVSLIGQVDKYDIELRRGLKKYLTKYKKLPDLKNRSDLKKLSNVMSTSKYKVDEKKLNKMIKVIGTQTVRSMFESMGEDLEGNVQNLIDTLKSGDKLPDEILQDREFAEAFKRAIQRYLKPDQRKVVMLYYLPRDPKDIRKTKEQLSKKIDMPLSTFKRHLDLGAKELQKSPALREFHEAAFKSRCIKLALVNYEYPSLRFSSTQDEQIIAEVLNARR